jgi:hypothetical protein
MLLAVFAAFAQSVVFTFSVKARYCSACTIHINKGAEVELDLESHISEQGCRFQSALWLSGYAHTKLGR